MVAVVADTATAREKMSGLIGESTAFCISGSFDTSHGREQLKLRRPDMIVGHVENESSFAAFQALANQFAEIPSFLIVSELNLLPDEGIDEAINAVAEIAEIRGNRAVIAKLDVLRNDASVEGVPLQEARRADQAKLEILTPKEREVLVLTAEGLSIKEIAARVNRAYGTIASHRNALMRKVGINDKVGLARFAIRVGLVSA